jgi:hypothetical protein
MWTHGGAATLTLMVAGEKAIDRGFARCTMACDTALQATRMPYQTSRRLRWKGAIR